MKGAVRRAEGFVRYAVSLQYHGGSFLGVSYQKNGEDCIVTKKNRHTGKETKVDLRGHRSVEGRLMEALDDLFGFDRWENLQTSSRTDRGVHALKNTFHVDIQTQETTKMSSASIEKKLRDGLNYHLSRQTIGPHEGRPTAAIHNPFRNELRILNAARAPEYMKNTEIGIARGQPAQVDWNARFSATQRRYLYRLLCPALTQQLPTGSLEIPFEWDRAWCLGYPLDVEKMRAAADRMVGHHDFTAFQGRLCQRKSPIVNLQSISILPPSNQSTRVYTMEFIANSFLYRQVRNMVGCLVEVGKPGGRLCADTIQDLILPATKEISSERPKFQRKFTTAPPQGLFLVDVRHGDFRF